MSTQIDVSTSNAPGIPSQNIVKQKINNGDTITADDVGALIAEVQDKSSTKVTVPNGAYPSVNEYQSSVPPSLSTNPVKRKAFEETKKIIDTFREKTASYPKYISYEGSMVLCVMLSMKDVATPHITNLPMVDQTTLRGLLPDKVAKKLDSFEVRFDENKDFIIKAPNADDTNVCISMLNAVAHPRPEDLKDSGAGDVPVENDGDRIAVGGKIIMDKRNIQRLGGIIVTGDHKPEADVELAPKRQPVSGRNAFEIRTDIMQMALDWSVANNKNGMSPAEVVNVAKVFYSFVENRR